MTRVLDELAQALHVVQRPQQRRVIVASLELHSQFEEPITPRIWHALAAQLVCFLPPLKRFADGQWTLPNRCDTVQDLAEIIADHHLEWDLPWRIRMADWTEAQVFAGVKATLVEALNLEPAEVFRSATLQGDLLAE
jgi:hypothetical protein